MQERIFGEQIRIFTEKTKHQAHTKYIVRRICDERQILGVIYKFGQRKLEGMVYKLAFSPSITVIYAERLKVAGNHKAWLF